MGRASVVDVSSNLRTEPLIGLRHRSIMQRLSLTMKISLSCIPSFIKIKKLLYLGYIDGDVISGKIRSLSLDTGISESSIRYIVSKERADKVYQITNSPLFKREAMTLGYDGMMAFEAGVDSFAIFSPSQVKSATENTGSFDGMNDDIRYSSHNAVEQEEYDMQDLEEVATSMAEVLGEDVRVIHDTAEIEGRNESETNRMRGAKGWYDPKTGQVVVVLPNAESADDVEATILHEVVGHKGLQELVGKDQFGKFLDEVFEGANEAVRNGIVERSKRYGWNTRLATEEYIARACRAGLQGSRSTRPVERCTQRLLQSPQPSEARVRLGTSATGELRYMLWRTYQMKRARAYGTG